MSRILDSITSSVVRQRAEEICRQKADVQLIRWMLGEENFLRWVHSAGVANDEELKLSAPAIPPESLRETVADPRVEIFLWTGLIDSENILGLDSQHRPASAKSRVLDFGVGCGRMARFFAQSPDLELSACDVNLEHVTWCQENLPKAQTCQNDYLPPTMYADGTFDLIYALSVFTHLTQEASALWRAEMSRILAPGGLLIATAHGIPAINTIKSSAQHQEMFNIRAEEAANLETRLEESGFLFFKYDEPVIKIAKAGADYGNTFIHSQYIHNRWNSEGLKVLAHLPGGLRYWQDIIVLRKE